MAHPVRPFARLAVLGLGNILLGDDAVGPTAAARLLARYRLPSHVRVEDLGTPGLDLTPYLLDVDAVLFIDAVRFGGPPGAVRLLGRDAILGRSLSPRVSPHDPGVQQALQIVELWQDRRIDASVLGIEPASVELGAWLSPEVRGALPVVERAALEWLRTRGAELEPAQRPEEAVS